MNDFQKALKAKTIICSDGFPVEDKSINKYESNLIGKILMEAVKKTASFDAHLIKDCLVYKENEDEKTAIGFSRKYKVFPTFILEYANINQDFKKAIDEMLLDIYKQLESEEDLVLPTLPTELVDKFFEWLGKSDLNGY